MSGEKQEGLIVWFGAVGPETKSQTELWFGAVGPTTKTELNIDKPYNRTTKIGATFGTYPKHEGKMSASINVESISNLKTVAEVDPNNHMNGEATIYPKVEEKTHVRLVVSGKENLPSRIEMELSNYLEGEAEVFGIGKEEAIAKIVVAIKDRLPAKISITPTNRMTGTVAIKEIPRVAKTLYPVKDSFVRSDVPRINYGDSSSMQLGYERTPYSSGELAEYKSIIQFDFIDVPDGAMIEKATMKLYPTYTSNSFSIHIQDNLTNWEEATVAWVNKPSVGNLSINHDINENDACIQVDVLEMVKRWVERENRVKNNGLTISSLKQEENFLTMFAREYEDKKLRPQLDIVYYDRDLSMSIDESEISVKARVAKDEVKTRRARIRILSQHGKDILPTSISMINPNLLPTNVKVSREALTTRLLVKGHEHLDTLMAIQESSVQELKSRTSVTREKIFTHLIVPEVETIRSKVLVEREGTKKIASALSLTREAIVGRVRVPYASKFLAEIEIQRLDKRMLKAGATVSRDFLKMVITTALKDTIHTQLHTSKEEDKNLNARLEVLKDGLEELYTKLELKYTKEINAHLKVISPFLPVNLTIQSTDKSKMGARIEVVSVMIHDLDVKIEVGNPRLLKSSIEVGEEWISYDFAYAFIM